MRLKAADSMRKRLRKKRRLGEFREYCFEVSLVLKPRLEESAFHAFVDEFLEGIESRNLQFGGGGSRERLSGVVEASGRRSPTSEDRLWVKEWLSAHPLVDSVTIGEFRDAWHGW